MWTTPAPAVDGTIIGQVHISKARRASDALDDLRRNLDGCGAMAGGDPVGRAWAARYDPAARPAVRAVADLARGDGAAGGASAGDGPPSALGGSPGAPVAWSLVARLADLAWPDGRAEALRLAARAWHRCAVALQDASDTDCAAARVRWQTVAGAHRTLGSACDGLADGLDRAHAGITTALAAHGLDARAVGPSTAAQHSAIRYAVPGGPVELAVGWRIAAASHAVRAVVADFATAVDEHARPLPLAGELCADVSRLAAPIRVGRHAAPALMRSA